MIMGFKQASELGTLQTIAEYMRELLAEQKRVNELLERLCEKEAA
jgi:hypothetical protein